MPYAHFETDLFLCSNALSQEINFAKLLACFQLLLSKTDSLSVFRRSYPITVDARYSFCLQLVGRRQGIRFFGENGRSF